MEVRTLKNLHAFMQRVQLTGNEAMAYVESMAELEREIEAKTKEQPPSSE